MGDSQGKAFAPMSEMPMMHVQPMYPPQTMQPMQPLPMGAPTGQMVMGSAFGEVEEDSALLKTGTPHQAVHSMEIGCISHSIVLGIALGLQTSQETVVLLLIVFVFHQAMEGACLSSLIASLDSQAAKLFFITATAGSMPLGILIGVLIEQNAGDSEGLAPWTAAIQCIGGGMLVYCTFMGITAFDVQHPDFVGSSVVRTWSFVLFTLGAAAMTVLVVGELAGGGHGH